MAQIYPKKLVEGVMPPTAGTSIYTAPNTPVGYPSWAATAHIKEIWLVNTTATPAFVMLGINSLAANNQLIPAQTVGANTAIPITGLNKMLKPTDTIWVIQGTQNAITLHIDGGEISS
jgi:hypothetical protein